MNMSHLPLISYKQTGLLGWVRILSDGYKVIVLVATSLLVGLVASAFSPEYPIYLCTGFIGGLLMLRLTDAAQFETGQEGSDLVRQRLVRSRFIPTGSAPER